MQGMGSVFSEEIVYDGGRVLNANLTDYKMPEFDGMVAAGEKLARLLASTQVELRFLAHSGHVLPLDRESAEVSRSIVSFFQGVG